MDSPITSVESFRFLGTTITQDLKWEPTISSLIKKAQQRMYFLRQLRKAKLPAQMLVQFYTAIIESILTSSITVWFAGATCRTVQIRILGEEGVPVQVDGEAWIQPPGFIRILHKNRTQTLTRDQAFENTLKSWEERQRSEFLRPQSQTEILSEDEASLISDFGQTAGALIHSIREVAELHSQLEQELAHAVNASSKAMDVVYKDSRSPGALRRCVVLQMVTNVKALLSETELLLSGNMSMQLERPHQEQLSSALSSLSNQISRLSEVSWLCPTIDQSDSESALSDVSKRGRAAKFRLVPKFKKEKNNRNKETSGSLSLPVHLWSPEEVGQWLEALSLSEYKEIFVRHDVRGAELLGLERRDLKDLGVSKVGHMKRILQGIKDLHRSSSASEA
uniref:SAM domain-containing protein n=1 Tax=Knipowitschia caucasica TaxID=637954 RepID=A0AAV2J637_KNICA